MSRRPWKVFVRNIGPTYTFATKDAAIARAQALIGPEFVLGGNLVGGGAEVLVYDTLEVPSRHIVFHPDREPVVEVLVEGRWLRDPCANIVAQEGCDRCFCGCKYWEGDRCIDCGTHVTKVPMGTDGTRDGTEV